MNSSPHSKVPGIFFLLLTGMLLTLLLEDALHGKGGEWPARMASALIMLAVIWYANREVASEE